MYRRKTFSQTDVSDQSGVSKSRARRAVFFVSLFAFLSLGAYLFSVNRNAVSGYAMRRAESRMTELSNEAQKLKIREAELRSLYGLEETSERLGMVPVSDFVSIDDSNSVAYGR